MGLSNPSYFITTKNKKNMEYQFVCKGNCGRL